MRRITEQGEGWGISFTAIETDKHEVLSSETIVKSEILSDM